MSQNEDQEYYLNEEGLVTFTEHYLLKRGYCCGNGCLHCPFDYEKVPEPIRFLLLKKRADRESHDQKESE